MIEIDGRRKSGSGTIVNRCSFSWKETSFKENWRSDITLIKKSLDIFSKKLEKKL